ncbi:MAG TPA: DinB family protein, partial [Saprospiraceae bacterium]|nr:DinB family protein [Saprospiraceae bacterium]
NVRFWHMEKQDKTIIKDSKSVKAEDEKTIDMLRELHEISTEWLTHVLTRSIIENKKIKGSKRGIIPYLSNFIAHESHHRGNILLTLKISGFKLPDTLKYTIWDWNNL